MKNNQQKWKLLQTQPYISKQIKHNKDFLQTENVLTLCLFTVTEQSVFSVIAQRYNHIIVADFT